MIIQCAWCNKYLGEKEPLDDKGVTHGMCPGCFEKEIAKIDKKEG